MGGHPNVSSTLIDGVVHVSPSSIGEVYINFGSSRRRIAEPDTESGIFAADSLDERTLREDSVHTHEILFVLGVLLSTIVLFRVYRHKQSIQTKHSSFLSWL